ncbi:glycosyltransferase family 4 protein [Geobacter sp.]|uniref:glycosyltransferase family 4 protein n=1 Tax=Geobacter sp. TaxID=46610 RepID=UPI0027B98C84|nr:glycosyltransferase family 4 protein [Geobacter sp.]
MRILYIAPLPPPVTGQSLAARRFLEDLKGRHEVKVINLSKEGFKQGVDSFGRIFEVMGVLCEVWWHRHAVDAVYLTISESVAGNIKDLLIYLACFRKLDRMLIHLHGGSLKKVLFNRSRMIRGLNAFFIRRLFGAVILGRSHLDIFEGMLERGRIHIVPNFADEALFLAEEEVPRKFSSFAPLRILFMSNLISGKGYDLLLEAYLGLDASLRQKLTLDFAGGFEAEADKQRFLDRIHFEEGVNYHGVVGDDQKLELLHKAHLFCLPTSLHEGQPISILEAYASGCAVITTAMGGIPDIFSDSVNGFVVGKESAASLRGALEEVLRNPDLLLPIAVHNRKLAGEEFRVGKYNKALNAIVESINA